jgi:3-oxoacyl-[acyl-carrier-protein] synthase II
VSKRRVVVTGLGMITAVGNNLEKSWDNIVKGVSGVKPIDHFDVSAFSAQISASIQDFDPSAVITPKDQRKMDLFIQYGLVAATEAIKDAGIDVLSEHDAPRCGVSIGSGIGGLPMIEKSHSLYEKSGPRKLSPFFIPGVIINMISGHVSIRHNMKGPNVAAVTACSTGAHNIGLSMRAIQYGDADMMICGGSEMAVSPLGIGGFAAIRALSTRNDAPEKASRPWDKDRDGFVLGSGAGVLVLEEYEHAKARGATIYAELAGFGMNADAFHMTAPESNGAGGAACMEIALADGAVNKEEVSYINAHGTSTPIGDEIEIKAIKTTFGAHATELAVSSTKSMIGHLLGAAGAVEAVFSVLALRDQIAPPTINLDNPSDICQDMNLVAHTAQERQMSVVVSNSFAFGGTNASLVFKKDR